MGTTRIKVIDLSGQQQEIKTSRKRAERLTAVAKLKEGKVSKVSEEKAITEGTEDKQKAQKGQTAKISSVPSAPSVPSVIKTKSKVTTQPRHQGKKYQTAAKLIDNSKVYPASEALSLLVKTSYTKFDPTVEIHLNVTDKNMRGSVNFPHAVGSKIKEKRYLVFSDNRQATTDKRIIFGGASTITDIEGGKLRPKRDFDLVVAQPKFMPALAKIAKILGPASIMPNPKTGTVTDNPSEFLRIKKGAGFEYRTDPTTPVIHTQIGKLSAKPQQLEDNLKALIAAIGPAKIKKAVVKSTMSPPVKLDLSTITQ